MNNSQKDSLQSISKIKAFNQGGVVFHIGEPAQSIFKVLRGEVHLYRHNENGNKLLLYRAYEGHYFAEASLNSEVYHCSAECIKESKIQIINSTKMILLLEKSPAFATQWISILSSELRRQRSSVERLNIKTAAERIKHYILTEGNSLGEVQIQGSLSDLSQVMGLSRESLYRTLSKMEKIGELVRTDQSLKLKETLK